MTHHDLATLCRTIYAGSGACGGEPVEVAGLLAEVIRHDDGTATVVYRGTTAPAGVTDWRGILDSILNWAYNLGTAKTPHAWGLTHEGFLHAWHRLRDPILERLDGIHEVTITGHSLGGALATANAASFEVMRARGATTLPAVREVVTFGSPRVGNTEYAANYLHQLGSVTTRYHFESDPVPLVPSALSWARLSEYITIPLSPFGFRHVVPPRWFTGDAWQDGLGAWAYAKNACRRVRSWIWDHHIDNYVTALAVEKSPAATVAAALPTGQVLHPYDQMLLAMGRPRSSKWPLVRRMHLEWHPRCEACGTGQDVEVHHIWPFAWPGGAERELDPLNLITLCPTHHFWLGHLGDWRSRHPDVVAEAKAFFAKVSRRQYATAA